MINEEISVGIDLGIGSCGWAVLRDPFASDDPAIEALGSWMFDVPETDKERTPSNQIRRANRLLRRVTRRRRKRMIDVRRLFAEYNLLADGHAENLVAAIHDPWEMRARGLDKPLQPDEFAVALAHIAKHRGFKSNAKNKATNNSSDDSKMLKAIADNTEKLAKYRTIGEMFARDPDYSVRRRNRGGDYSHTVRREDLQAETRTLFARQRSLGQGFASAKLEEKFAETAFFQRPFQDSAKLVGACGFEPGEKRGAKLAPSFERFRLLTRLINLRWRDDQGERPLTPDEIARVTADLGKTAKLTTKIVRTMIGLPDNGRFTAIRLQDEGHDIAARTGEAMAGTAALRKVLGGTLWAQMQAKLKALDDIAYVLSFFETVESITVEIEKLKLGDEVRTALARGLEDGAFAKFKGAAHISAKAARALLPYLAQGLRYDEACAKEGYDHSASGIAKRQQVTNKTEFKELLADLQDAIPNPIARKALTEALKQLWAIRNKYGLPGRIHIELARDVGNSLEKRREIENGIKDRTAAKERLRVELQKLLSLDHVSSEDLLRYELWKEQGGRCLYSNSEIHITQVVATDNSVQVDHILPWSRFGDDSFVNKTLCLAQANQRKKGRTPFEWLGVEKSEEWQRFAREVENSKSMKGMKKRNYLLKGAKEVEEKFRSRNLNDTRYACRIFAEAAKLFYPKDEGTRRVFTRPGRLTAALRQAWGLESLKKVDGVRLRDDRHHALDALVVAAVGDGAIQYLTQSFQKGEEQGDARTLRHVDYPWPGFRAAAKEAFENVFVARAERRRARGEGHAATIRQIVEREEGIFVYERKSIVDLTVKDLDRIKDPERNQAMIGALRTWIETGKSASAPPSLPNGGAIVKIRLLTNKKIDVEVRGGTAERGEMVRVDVFTKPNKRGKPEFYLVPIYPHQVIDKKDWPMPPNRAVVAYKLESEWPIMDETYEFLTSIFPRSFIELVKPSGKVLEGYFCGMNRSTGALSLFEHNAPDQITGSIGAKTLMSIKKFSIDRLGCDRLGCKGEVKGEMRTWHGAPCISATRPG